MFKIIMISPGGIKRDLYGGFNTEKGAENYAEQLNWEHYDENGFRWALDVVEDYYVGPKQLTMPNVQWAKTFLELQDTCDESALQYLDDAMENTFDNQRRQEYLALRRLVSAALSMNTVTTLMETEELEPISELFSAYKYIFNVLRAICEEALND